MTTEYIECPEEPEGNLVRGTPEAIEAACLTLGATIVRGKAHLPSCRCHGTGKVQATKLVSAEEAKRWLEVVKTLPGTEPWRAVGRMAETVQALWPIVEWAAREPCHDIGGRGCKAVSDDVSKWCHPCRAGKFLAKEAKP